MTGGSTTPMKRSSPFANIDGNPKKKQLRADAFVTRPEDDTTPLSTPKNILSMDLCRIIKLHPTAKTLKEMKGMNPVEGIYSEYVKMSEERMTLEEKETELNELLKSQRTHCNGRFLLKITRGTFININCT